MNGNSIKFRFPCITAGYLGIKQEQQTLNSAFYAELFSGNYDFSKQIIIPQRVPKKELFDELLMLEENATVNLLKTQLNMLLQSMHAAFDLLKKDKSKARYFLNWLNILLRYGLFIEISALDSDLIKPILNSSDFIEFELIKAIAYFRTKESDETLINLSKAVLSSTNLNKRVQILALNYLIVAAYRFQIKLPYEDCLKIGCEKLIGLIENEIENDFGTLIRKSVAYRGLAMVNELNTSLKQQYLNQAELIARNINASSKLEDLVAKENLYTCLQTLSKWNQQNNQLEAAQSNLVELIKLDPYDSTGYAELGFFLLEQNSIKEASINFARAAELGPPAVGMHIYYYAKTLQLLGNKKAAVSALYEVIKIDEEAVSPWLDLIEHYLEMNAVDKAKEIIINILKSPIYRSQLEDNEIGQLEIQLEKL